MRGILAYRGMLLGAGFDVDALAIIARMSVAPSAAIQTAINNCVVQLKGGNYFQRMDSLYVPIKASAQQAGLLDWRRVVSATLNGTATWTAANGFNGTGSAGAYVNTLFNPSTQGVNYTQNSASMGFYINTIGAAFTSYGGCGTSPYVYVQEDSTSRLTAVINGTTTVTSANTTSGTGLVVASRTASNAWHLSRNGTQIITSANASTARPNMNAYLLATGNGAGGAQPTAGKLSYWWAGAGFTLAEEAAIKTIFDTYIAAIP